MTYRTCQHDDCNRVGIAEWNGCVFCDEHVRERLRTAADEALYARITALERQRNDLAMLLRRVLHHDLPSVHVQAREYLERHGLTGSVLR